MNHANVTWHDDAETRPLRAALVAGDYFRVLPVSPARGRILTPADAREPVAVIAHRLWTQRLAAAEDAIGRRLRLNGTAYTIVGIAPPAFSGTEVEAVDVWLPLESASVADGKEGVPGERNLSWLQIFGRLRPATSVSAARAEATVIASQLEQEYPGRRTSIELMRASRLDRGGVGQSRGRSRVMTMSAVAVSISGLLFLVCGSNAAALLLARGASRQKETAVRVALGASRRHIVRQLAAEVGMVAAASAAVGVLVCVATMQALAGVLPMQDLLLGIRPDLRVFGFAFAAAFLVAALFSLGPARQALQVDCLGSLKAAGSVVGDSVRALRLRRGLIVVQITVSVVLLVAAALLGRGVSQAWLADPGYAVHGLHVVQPDANWEPGLRSADRGALGMQVAEALVSEPGVRAVARATLAPFFGTGVSRAASGSTAPIEPVRFNQVDDRYFSALGVPLLAGRPFQPREEDAVIINASLARRLFANEQDALGRTLYVEAYADDRVSLRPLHVIGVTPTLQTTDIGIADGPTYYTLMTDEQAATAFLLVRADASLPVSQVVGEQRAGD